VGRLVAIFFAFHKLMKFVIQRVINASVIIKNSESGILLNKKSIQSGLVILMGIHGDDKASDCDKWIQKILNLRIFADEAKPINRSIQDINGEILLISQFTLYADLKGQNRPSFMAAAKPEQAKEIYDAFVNKLEKAWPKTKTGEFAADMQVSLVNDGPVTIILDNTNS
jgi:D-aminoacyl-tRNA deacylase